MAPAVPFIPRSRVPRSISPAPMPVEDSTAIIFVAAGLNRCSRSPKSGSRRWLRGGIRAHTSARSPDGLRRRRFKGRRSCQTHLKASLPSSSRGRLAHWPVGRAFGRCIGQAPSLALVLVLNEIPWRDRRWGLARLHVELLPVSPAHSAPRVLMTRTEGLVRV
jgi:hypothetical protein